MAGKDKRPQAWTREQRLEALLATHGLAEQELGAWCRQRGIHTHHLAQWRSELIGAVPERTLASETRALRQENQALKKELRRKDKALAETAALLVLKKKPLPSGGKARTIDRRRGASTSPRVDRRGGGWRRAQGMCVRGAGIVTA